MARTLSNPTIEVNDEIIAIVPNSLSFKEGIGDKNVRSQSAGGNSVDPVITENAETKIGMCKFKLYNTAVSLALATDWTNRFGSSIRIYEQDFNISFRDMVVTTEPERLIGADGDLEIEWMGRPSQ